MALKDNIALAGVPMTAASRAMVGIVPDFDAVVTERLLDAGATIIGKLNQDDMSSAGVGDTSAFGAPRNPCNPEYSAGGSSSASGACVMAGAADLTLGVDQAGSGANSRRLGRSMRHQSNPWPGAILRHFYNRPQPGLHLSHSANGFRGGCGARGHRWRGLPDPQWVRGPINVEEYSQALRPDVDGLRIGVLKESFEWDESEEEVSQATRAAVRHLVDMGATAQEVSVPLWKDGWPIWMAVGGQSYTAMVESEQQGYFHKGLAMPTFAEAFGKSRRLGGDHFPPQVKLIMIVSKYLNKQYFNSYFAKGQNLRRMLTDQVDAALSQVDVLITPTTPMKPMKLLGSNISVGDWAERAGINVQNTSPLDLTGHPAITLPCGVGEGNLPIALQLVGKHWAESLLFRVAYTYEQSAGVTITPAVTYN